MSDTSTTYNATVFKKKSGHYLVINKNIDGTKSIGTSTKLGVATINPDLRNIPREERQQLLTEYDMVHVKVTTSVIEAEDPA
ncbi:MAG: hypothetical protein GQ570_03680 [Helicobacteraceae bacterium]|nr:hypothetical protein [Helicobacteraceae bacterium]